MYTYDNGTCLDRDVLNRKKMFDQIFFKQTKSFKKNSHRDFSSSCAYKEVASFIGTVIEPCLKIIKYCKKTASIRLFLGVLNKPQIL